MGVLVGDELGGVVEVYATWGGSGGRVCSMCLARDMFGGAFELRSMGWQLGRLVGDGRVGGERLVVWPSFLVCASRDLV